jgi:hypothetical protein
MINKEGKKDTKGGNLRKRHLKENGMNKTKKKLYRKDDMERKSKMGL